MEFLFIDPPVDPDAASVDSSVESSVEDVEERDRLARIKEYEKTYKGIDLDGIQGKMKVKDLHKLGPLTTLASFGATALGGNARSFPLLAATHPFNITVSFFFPPFFTVFLLL